MAKIGVFDSGYGGLTILDAIRKELPQYDYLYLGDNARAPYGTHSFDVIYRYTLQAVKYLLEQDCALVILACNTASAKALRTIQQRDLPLIKDKKVNVLGVIRPTVEAVPAITKTGHVGILATPATVSSESYVLELEKIAPELTIVQQACPMWVPLIEAGEHNEPGAKYFIGKYLLKPGNIMNPVRNTSSVSTCASCWPKIRRLIPSFSDARTIRCSKTGLTSG